MLGACAASCVRVSVLVRTRCMYGVLCTGVGFCAYAMPVRRSVGIGNASNASFKLISAAS